MAEQDGASVATWPRLRLDFYNTAVVMSQWTEDGRTTTYPVAVQDVVSACTTVALGSGLLPPDVLFWRQRGQIVTLGIYVPARRWRVQVEEGAVRQGYHLPLPPLVFVGSGTAYHVFAVRRRPCNGREPLYEAPCPMFTTPAISVRATRLFRSARRRASGRRWICSWKAAPSTPT
jgi:hypothetical protein